jgi:peptide/nickel transport system substrate-binding protein
MLGTGAWTLTKFEASVSLDYRKNPNWWRKDRPFLDGFFLAILKERAQEIAQFRAANTWWSGIPAELQLETKRDLPELLMIENTDLSVSSPHIKFSWRPNSPFRDERVRRAVSLAIDRDLFAEALTDREKFAAAGFPQDILWASHIGPGYGPLWLDPKADKGKALGEGGKNFQYDPPEARKLLAAAGHRDILRTESHFNAGTNYGQNYHRDIEIITGMLEDVGFEIARKPEEYQNEWLPKYFYGRGDFDGLSWVPGGGRSAIGQFLQTFYHSSGQGNIPPGVDPHLDSLVEKQARELDKNKRTELIHEIQRYNAKEMKLVPYSHAVPGFALAWPWVGNFGAFVPWPGSEVQQNVYVHTWIDPAKLPARFKSS